MPSSPARRAFTLVEILVVVGVVLLLAGLLFPVASRVRENARRRTCQSNLQQVGLAFAQYAQDASGKYPYSGNLYLWAPGSAHWVVGTLEEPIADIVTEEPVPDATSSTGFKMAGITNGSLFPYVKNTAYYVCPSSKDGFKKGLSYSMNCALTGLRTQLIRSPADIVLLVDEEKANDGYFFAVDDAKAGSTVSGVVTNSTDALSKVHSGGGNILFADGHVGWFNSASFTLDASAQGKTNKWKEDGSPRFHDKLFGKWGSNSLPGQATDACNATTRTP